MIWYNLTGCHRCVITRKGGDAQVISTAACGRIASAPCILHCMKLCRAHCTAASALTSAVHGMPSVRGRSERSGESCASGHGVAVKLHGGLEL